MLSNMNCSLHCCYASHQYPPWNQNALLNSSFFILLNSKAIAWTCETHLNAFCLFSKKWKTKMATVSNFPIMGISKSLPWECHIWSKPLPWGKTSQSKSHFGPPVICVKTFLQFFVLINSWITLLCLLVAFHACCPRHVSRKPVPTDDTNKWAKAPVFQSSWLFLFQLDIAKYIYAPKTRDDKGYITVKRRRTTDRFDNN